MHGHSRIAFGRGIATKSITQLPEIDLAYAKRIAGDLGQFRTNPALGYRTAGSFAEHQAADYLAREMRALRLPQVEKEAIPLDAWTFHHARLSYTLPDGANHISELGGYQIQMDTEGPKPFQLIYGGRGTKDDLEKLDVRGKLVLIDIDQLNDWWINYPAYEAHLHGAAAVLAAQSGGYAQISPDALNAQDFCGPSNTPAFSISRRDADRLQDILRQAPGKEMPVELDALSQVMLNGVGYNVVGTIPGKEPGKRIVVSAHYDAYFEGCQDNATAVALMLGLAKAVMDAGYQPEKTLHFVAFAGEEWGVSDSRFDWSTGAYRHVFDLHPEWRGSTFANINFELPGYDLGLKTNQVRASYELQRFVENVAQSVPPVEGIFPDGIEVVVPTQTWSDDFSLAIAGIPATVNCLRDEYAVSRYHTQFDDESTFSPQAMTHNHRLYGNLLLAYDACALPPLHYTARLIALKESMDQDAFAREGIETTPFDVSYQEVFSLAESVQAMIDKCNRGKMEALEDVHQSMLSLFGHAQDSLTKLHWNGIAAFPHEIPLENLSALHMAEDALQRGDSLAAIHALRLVDHNWYAADFSYETYRRFIDYAMGFAPQRLTWGNLRLGEAEDLYQEIQALLEDQAPVPVQQAIQRSIRRQRKALRKAIEGERSVLHAFSWTFRRILADVSGETFDPWPNVLVPQSWRTPSGDHPEERSLDEDTEQRP